MDGIANEAHLRTFLGDEVYRDYFETERGAEGGTSDTAHLELGGVNDASASVISDDDAQSLYLAAIIYCAITIMAQGYGFKCLSCKYLSCKCLSCKCLSNLDTCF